MIEYFLKLNAVTKEKDEAKIVYNEKLKQEIRIWFCDFWEGFGPKSFFYRFIEKRFKIILDKENPDFIIYSVFGDDFRNYTCPRIFYTAENTPPPPLTTVCDFAFSYTESSADFNYRLPWSAICQDIPAIAKARGNTTIADKTSFCNFIYSNPRCPQRNHFFHLLSQYKKVEAGGKLFNNIKEKNIPTAK